MIEMTRRFSRCAVALVIVFFTVLLLLFKLLPDGPAVELDLIEPNYMVEDVNYGDKLLGDNLDGHDSGLFNISSSDIKYPIILWWNPLTGERGKVKTCPNGVRCFLTTDRHYQSHPKTRVFLFYGTDFNRGDDLPLPRRPSDEWGLFHEESPKNNYVLTQKEIITLFNHTATFQRTSDYPLTTQYLGDLSDLVNEDFFIPLEGKNKIEGIAPVVYIHTDCDPPSDRDSYVRELMKYIPIDSYGKCLHNRDLPPELQDPTSMDEASLYRILAKYKFTLSIENAICDDYITEKLWRPLKLGSVPIYRGSPSVRDWLPSNHSAILIDDFDSPRKLAEYLKFLLRNEKEYEKYFEHRTGGGLRNDRLLKAMELREWGVNNYRKMNYITGFECFVCNRIHKNLKGGERRNEKQILYKAEPDHLHCPRPETYDFGGSKRGPRLSYQQWFDQSKKEAVALRERITST